MSAIVAANANTKQDYKGVYLDFNLNLNLPPPCNTGFLPVRQQRSPSDVDYPERPAGELYCRVPQDSELNVRGVRNIPCETVPGKRAPTVEMCESDEQYVPLNDGFNWKGDPNATLSGQGVPQYAPGADPRLPPPAGTGAAPPPVAALPPTLLPRTATTGRFRALRSGDRRLRRARRQPLYAGRSRAPAEQDLAVNAGPAEPVAVAYGRAMAVSDSREVVIEATPEEILDVIADVKTAPDWSSQHQGAEILDTDENGRPGRVKLKLKTMGIADEQVVQYTWTDNSAGWTLVSSSQLKTQDAKYTLTPDGDKTG